MIESLAWPISLEEFTVALKAMASSKAPGPDGILTELYKSLWHVIGPDYLRMIEASMNTSALPDGVTEGLIALLHKGGGRATLNNWRPITLLNVLYKLFAKALQMCLQAVLMEVISHDQSAFLPMRFILDNIFLTYETIHHAQQSNQPLFFLKLDFSIAYDKVDLGFLFEGLVRMGFPARFIQMTSLLFQNVVAWVSVNGKVIHTFSIQQGVRQGYPLTPYLFFIVGKILNFALKQEVRQGRIRGIDIPGADEPQTVA
jgi:hypothetical protein